MLLSLPADVLGDLAEHQRRAFHAVAELEWKEGNRLRAWGWHLRSLASKGGWRHLFYSRRLTGPPSRQA
jgi:hypothetical protein